MIVTPDHLIRKYFPEPIESTRELYDRLGLDEFGYSYLNWIKDAEEHCLSKYMDESDYKLLPDEEKNFWISKKAFLTLLQASPSKIGDELRACYNDIAKKLTSDPTFARKLQDQMDREAGVEILPARASKKLKTQYNQAGHDVFEFSVQADSRLYMDIISAYNFQPGQKIKDASFVLKFETENNIPFHIVLLTLSLNNDQILSYRTVWSCEKERSSYAAILMNKMIRINVFEDNKKLVDSYDYIFNTSELNTLQSELEKVIGMLMGTDWREINVDELGKKILHRYNLNDRAYAMAITSIVTTLAKDKDKENADALESAFIDAVNKYWEYYILQPDPTKNLIDDIDRMVEDRLPRVALAMCVTNMLSFNDLFDKYFKRRYSDKQKQSLLRDGNIHLIFTLSEAEFDPGADSNKRVDDMCSLISDHLDLIRKTLVDAGQWPN